MSAREPMILLERVRKSYPDGTVAVTDLSFEVAAGELLCLVGPSGCGKTTILRMINRLIEPTSGRIMVDGEDVSRSNPVWLRRRIGYVIQQVGLFPHQTVAANVATVPRLLRWNRKRTRARVRELLELVGLDPDEVAGRYPRELSGGQQQRVGVARALAADPPVLLMDEPFSAIDPVARGRLQAEFLRLQAEIRKTVVFVTHDLAEAVRLGDRIAVLRRGGVLEQLDSPARVLGAPATEFVADFTGSDRLLLQLSVTPLRREDLEPWPAAGPAPGAPPAGPPLAPPAPRGPQDQHGPAAIEVGASLKDALAALLARDDGRLAVHERGVPVGLLTPTSLHSAMRRSFRQAASEEASEDSVPEASS